MDLSTAHAAARAAAARLPALEASFDLLTASPNTASLLIYDALDVLLVTIPLDAIPGAINAETHVITLTVPLEGQITTTGTADHATILDGAGALWAENISVSDEEGSGEIKLQAASLTAGAFTRLTEGILQG